MSVMRASWEDGIAPRARVLEYGLPDGRQVRRLVYPGIPPGSNALKRMHFQQVARLRRGIHDVMTGVLADWSRDPELPPEPFGRALLSLEFRWRTATKRDPLNYVEGAKAIVDALIGVWITDDDAEHLEAIVRGAVGTREPDHVLVTVQELDDVEEVGRVLTP